MLVLTLHRSDMAAPACKANVSSAAAPAIVLMQRPPRCCSRRFCKDTPCRQMVAPRLFAESRRAASAARSSDVRRNLVC